MFPYDSRYELSKTNCGNLDWTTPKGDYHVAAGLRLFELLEACGILTLPPPRDTTAKSARKPVAHVRASDPQPEITCTLAALEPLTLQAATSRCGTRSRTLPIRGGGQPDAAGRSAAGDQRRLRRRTAPSPSSSSTSQPGLDGSSTWMGTKAPSPVSRQSRRRQFDEVFGVNPCSAQNHAKLMPLSSKSLRIDSHSSGLRLIATTWLPGSTAAFPIPVPRNCPCARRTHPNCPDTGFRPQRKTEAFQSDRLHATHKTEKVRTWLSPPQALACPLHADLGVLDQLNRALVR